MKQLNFIIFSLMLCFVCPCYAKLKKTHTHKKPENNYVIPDTILVNTKTGIDIKRYYVVKDSCTLIVTTHSDNTTDTIYHKGIDEDIAENYHSELRTIKVRQKPISEINDREVFDYFRMGETITEFLQLLGNKKVNETFRGYEVSFPDEYTGKPIMFEFIFFDEKLSGITRKSHINSLPTNDVRTAFQLIHARESLNDLKKAIDRLDKKTQRSIRKRAHQKKSKRKAR